MVKSESTASQYQALLDIAGAIALHRDMPSLLSELARHLSTVVQFNGINILLHEPTRNSMVRLAVEAQIEHFIPQEFPMEGTPAGWVWENQQPLLVDNTGKETRFETNRLIYESGLKSYCLLPLTSGERRLGTLGFASFEEAAYRQTDIEFLQRVANQVAVAVDNALNLENVQAAQQYLASERDRFRLLLEVNNAVTAHLDLRELFAAISTSLYRVMKCNAIGLTLYDSESGMLRAYALDGRLMDNMIFEEGELIPIEGTPGGRAFTSMQTMFGLLH